MQAGSTCINLPFDLIVMWRTYPPAPAPSTQFHYQHLAEAKSHCRFERWYN